MNERIQELALQADLIRYPSDEINIKIEKLAELIVRECIAIVEPSSYRRAYPENYRGGMDCLDTLDDRVEKIREHFGVEA